MYAVNEIIPIFLALIGLVVMAVLWHFAGWKWAVGALVGVMAVFFLAGCSGLDKIHAVEKGIIEPAVDKGYDELVNRWCKMPVDIQNRAINRKTITPRSLTDNCPDWRAIRDALIGEAMETLQLKRPE